MDLNHYFVNIDGQIVKGNEAKISVFDRGFLFGDSVYEVTCSLDDKIFRLGQHIKRLRLSAEKINFTIPFEDDFIKDQIKKTLRIAHFKEAYIRLIITRGTGEIGLDPSLAHSPSFIIFCKELTPNPPQWYIEGVKMIIAQTQRNSKNSLDPSIKSGNYLNNLMAHTEAKKEGAFDAIMLNSQGYVTEGTTNNIWIVKNQTVITPPIEAGLLEGLTRKNLLEMMKRAKIEFKEANLLPSDLYQADEAFLTSTTRRIVPIRQIDQSPPFKTIPGPLTSRLMQIYREEIAKEYEI